MASKKSGGSTRNGRDSQSKRLGVKRFGGEMVSAGSIIIRQRGTKVFSGSNTGQGRDHTLYASRSGLVSFHRKGGKLFVSVNQMAVLLVCLIIVMLGSSYAFVPLYKLFRENFSGDSLRQVNIVGKLSNSKEYVINLRGSVDTRISLVPYDQKINVAAGESSLVFYKVTNGSDNEVVGIATYNVSPQRAGLYFNKVQCFCFQEQRIMPNESVDMPVFFYIDPSIVSDPRMSHVGELTLSYTFFTSQIG